MKHLKKFKEKEVEDVKFSAKSLEKGKEDKPGFTTSVDDQEKIDKEFKKELEKIHKFEAFIDIHIDNIENVECENEFGDDDDFDAEYEEGEGCGCCDKCTGEPGCYCGCDDCQCGTEVYCDSCDSIETKCVCGDEGTEDLLYHIAKAIPVTESIFRPGSKKFFSLIRESRRLFESGKVELTDIDKELFESTEIGKFAYFNGELVPLDLPMENITELNEAEYQGKEVELNHPMRAKGGKKKYYVYVKNPKTGKVKKISFGDVHGGLTAKVSNPEARKSFAARHKCSTKKDKTKAGYWACRINKYGHLWGGKTYPGYW
jgi:hypothetical protein